MQYEFDLSFTGRNKVEYLDNVPRFKPLALLNSYLWIFENSILEIQVQERVSEF